MHCVKVVNFDSRARPQFNFFGSIQALSQWFKRTYLKVSTVFALYSVYIDNVWEFPQYAT